MKTITPWATAYLKEVDKLWSEGDYEAGWQILEAILYEEPGCAKAHGYAAWYCHHQIADRNKAALHYEYALTFDPTWSYTYEHYADFLIEDRNVSRMKALLDEGMKHPDVDKADLNNDYGRVLEISGHYSEAASYYKSGMKYSMCNYGMEMMKANRKRARSKIRLFKRWYSALL